MSVALLDVNVLVALFDPDHVHHEPAHAWFGAHRERGWATCPITENGLVRILSNAAYAGVHQTAARVVEQLVRFCESGDHVFWTDELSLRDRRAFRLSAVAYRQLTDVYLLGLARANDGVLATFDRSIPAGAIPGGDAFVELIPA